MKCLTHQETEAVAVCVRCGRALCSKCLVRSPSGRFVCSEGCAISAERIESLIVATKRKNDRGARVVAYLATGVAVLFCISAIFFWLEGIWPLAVFVGLAGVALGLAGIGFLRIAKRNEKEAI